MPIIGYTSFGRSRTKAGVAMLIALATLLLWLLMQVDTKWKRQWTNSCVNSAVRDTKIPARRESALRYLRTLAQGEWSFGATIAVLALGDVEDRNGDVLNLIEAACMSSNRYVKRSAAQALQRQGRNAVRSVPILAQLLGEPIFDAAIFAADALAELGPEACAARESLLRAEKSSSRLVAEAARRALSMLNCPE